MSPPSEEHPGPPFSQRTSGVESDEFCASVSLKLSILFLRNTIKPLSVRDNGDERYKKIGRKMTLTRIKCRNDVSCKSSPVEEFIALACLEVSGMLVEVECPCHTRQLLTNHVLLSTIICELRQSTIFLCDNHIHVQVSLLSP